MEMKQSISNKDARGTAGEKRVAEAIASLGFKVIHVGGAVKFTINGTRFFVADLLPYGKGHSFWVQVKYKAPKRKWGDTGLERSGYDALWQLQEESDLPVALLFTDDLGPGAAPRIYGDWLERLPASKSHSGRAVWNRKDQRWMIYFLVERLRDYREVLSHIPEVPRQMKIVSEE